MFVIQYQLEAEGDWSQFSSVNQDSLVYVKELMKKKFRTLPENK